MGKIKGFFIKTGEFKNISIKKLSSVSIAPTILQESQRIKGLTLQKLHELTEHLTRKEK